MPIHTVTSSPEAIKVVLENVPRHLLAAPANSRSRAMAESMDNVSVTQPHRVFVASLADVLAKQVLANASESTTRYFLVDNDSEPFAAAEVSGQDFAHVNEGPFVGGTARAMIAAEELGQTAPHDYELRLLRIPSLYTVAVWLSAAADDILIPAEPAPAPLVADRPYNEADFTNALMPLAEVRSRAADSMG